MLDALQQQQQQIRRWMMASKTNKHNVDGATLYAHGIVVRLMLVIPKSKVFCEEPKTFNRRLVNRELEWMDSFMFQP
jgi:hypothetical protein